MEYELFIDAVQQQNSLKKSLTDKYKVIGNK